MLYGIGCDLCQIDRIEKLLAGPHGPAFVRRVFGPEERAALGLDQPPPPDRAGRRLAGRAAANFAAKEAFLKAAGTGLAGPYLPYTLTAPAESLRFVFGTLFQVPFEKTSFSFHLSKIIQTTANSRRIYCGCTQILFKV